MGRKARVQSAGVIYHVGSRGVDKQSIFGVVEHDWSVFDMYVGKTVEKHGWRCYATCFMRNHFHLVLETPRANLSDGMRYLKSSYARWFNEFKEREGALFERRYWSEIVDTEEYALQLAHYVPLNPVRAGWVERPEDWQWSSYAATVGLAKAPAYLDVTGVLDWYGGGDLGRMRLARTMGEALAALRP